MLLTFLASHNGRLDLHGSKAHQGWVAEVALGLSKTIQYHATVSAIVRPKASVYSLRSRYMDLLPSKENQRILMTAQLQPPLFRTHHPQSVTAGWFNLSILLTTIRKPKRILKPLRKTAV